ncbi:MAG TPA: NACHT domain-containing protein [Solirubrobacterales bacterium]|nr:NACHT domain-containing protein [Solirubrobacterales bacterium]
MEERTLYPSFELEAPGSPPEPLDLAAQARTLLGILALVVDGERAGKLESRFGSKGAYNGARSTLIAELEKRGAADLLVLPREAANGRGPLRLRHERCEVDLIQLQKAVEDGETERIMEITREGMGTVDFDRWGPVLADSKAIDLDADSWEKTAAGARGAARVAPAAVSDYLERLESHCMALPDWFPAGLRFDEIMQDVAVRPPPSDAEKADEESEDEPEISGTAEGSRQIQERDARTQGPTRRLPWPTALRQLRRVFLIGDPGAGKTWAIRASAMSFAKTWYSRPSEALLPILVLAPKLEEQLRELGANAGRKELIAALSSSMPDDLAAGEGSSDLVAAALERRDPVALLIDGYDEIRTERPRLARRLGDIVQLLDPEASYFALASRPSSAPERRLARVAARCDLQPFAEREQLRFVDRWFADDLDRARQAGKWVTDRRLDLLRTPLLIALFCAVFGSSKDSPPESEPDLLQRAIARLSSEEDRYEEVSEKSELVRLRMSLLEHLAGAFITPNGLLDAATVSGAEETLVELPAWTQLENLSSAATVIDDLAATGVVQKTVGGAEQELMFLHSALRDYLLARLLARTEGWGRYVSRLWAQPEWEPVIGYAGALLDEPDELLLSLETHFGDDPLNASRFTAGRVLAVAGSKVGSRRRRSVRDQLLILLGSQDSIDRNRSAALLASLQDAETAAMVRSLVNPAVPTHVVIAALRTIGGGTSSESIETLADAARSHDFTEAEQGAAVEALADMGSDAALAALGQLSEEVGVDPTTRAGAAFYALRLFGDKGPTRRLLETREASSRAGRWILAETLAAQAEVVGDLLEEIQEGQVEVEDPYCRALFGSINESPESGKAELVAALPHLDVVDRVAAAIESARERSAEDPLMIPLARYILDSGRPPLLRLRLAAAILGEPELKAPETVASLQPRESLEIAQFLVRDAAELPDELAKSLEQGLRAGDFGPGGQLAMEELAAHELPPSEPAAEEDGAPEDEPEGAVEEPSLEAIFRSQLDRGIQYQLLREQRRTLPASGYVRELASSLTHSISAGQATHWIDAQPAVAPLVEGRLLQSTYHDWATELAALRARWPGRYEEVADMAGAFNARLLDARAEAALLSDNFDEAATMALASIGARQAERRPPTSLSVIVLLAAGAAAGRTHSTLRQVAVYVPALPKTYADVILRAWWEAATMRFGGVEEMLNLLPPYSEATDANVAGLRMAAELAGPEAFEGIVSWAACKRVSLLLGALQHLTESASVKERIQAATAAAERHAASLVQAWPPSALDPGDQAKPKWANALVDIAAGQLLEGRADCAADIYAAVVKEHPNNPNFVNNLGFCQVPVDREAARRTLERAAELYGRPFGVNVANRMLIDLLRGEPERAHKLGEEYYAQGPAERDGAILWDIDNPTVLQRGVNVLDYIVSIGRKAALAMGRDDYYHRWDQRKQSLQAEIEDEIEVAADNAAEDA